MKKQALYVMMILLSAVIIFQILVVIQVIPYNIVWAGKLKTVQEMYVFETISISLNIFLLWVIFQKANVTVRLIAEKYLNFILWLFVLVFALNTLGNLFAENTLELILGTLLTLLCSILCWLIVRNEKRIEK